MAAAFDMKLLESHRESLFATRARTLATLVDSVLALAGTVVLVRILTVGDTLGRSAADGDRLGPSAFDFGVALAFGGPAVWTLSAAAFMLFRRWTFAWIVHWVAIMCAIVFGIAAGVLLALGSNS